MFIAPERCTRSISERFLIQPIKPKFILFIINYKYFKYYLNSFLIATEIVWSIVFVILPVQKCFFYMNKWPRTLYKIVSAKCKVYVWLLNRFRSLSCHTCCDWPVPGAQFRRYLSLKKSSILDPHAWTIVNHADPVLT